MIDYKKQRKLDVLTRHAARLDVLIHKSDRLDERYVVIRIGTFVIGGAIVLAALFLGPASYKIPLFAIFVGVFFVVVLLHRLLDRKRLRLRLARSLVTSQLARMQLDWENIPGPVSIRYDVNHAFASDLNLFGDRSLHQLVDTATSQGGSDRLANWLLNMVPDLPLIQKRAEIVKEILPLTGLRNRLGLLGLVVREELKGPWDGEKILLWLEKSMAPRSLLPTLILLLGMAIVNFSLFVLFIFGFLPAYWVIGLAVYATLYLYKYPAYKSLFEDTYIIGQSLNQFRAILAYLERYPYEKGSRLAHLCTPFTRKGEQPSRFLRRMVWLTSAASLGNNFMTAMFVNAIIPWNLLFTYILDQYKKSLKNSLTIWLDTWYEVEALCSLANFAALNPGFAFPNVYSQAGGENYQPVFEAKGIGHPLIQDHIRVCNDFRFNQTGDLAIITGSNMSGKSTFLRTLGINLCLAYAGGPVNAVSLTTIPLRLFTCIQVSDSLVNGISYFYAEVKRLKALLETLATDSPFPVVFLIDEIYRGTNNRERQIGSRAYVRSLTKQHGLGIISTHDLELVKLAVESPYVVNYHFREDIRDERMVFDYLLRQGPCPTTNALRIMALEGLPVE